MKKFIFTGLLSALPVIANARVAYDRGYCVPFEAPLIKQNAILIVDGSIANNKAQVDPRQHMFFSPYSMESLSAVDWGGMLSIEKTGEVNRHVSLAVVESTMFSISIPKQVVKCVADGAEEL